jgi:hypothetical protein
MAKAFQQTPNVEQKSLASASEKPGPEAPVFWGTAAAEERVRVAKAFEKPPGAERASSFAAASASKVPAQGRPAPQGVAAREALRAPDSDRQPREPAAWRAESAPRVHIGRIDIVVQAAETQRPGAAPAAISSDAASRFYLRRL